MILRVEKLSRAYDHGVKYINVGDLRTLDANAEQREGSRRYFITCHYAKNPTVAMGSYPLLALDINSLAKASQGSWSLAM